MTATTIIDRLLLVATFALAIAPMAAVLFQAAVV